MTGGNYTDVVPPPGSYHRREPLTAFVHDEHLRLRALPDDERTIVLPFRLVDPNEPRSRP